MVLTTLFKITLTFLLYALLKILQLLYKIFLKNTFSRYLTIPGLLRYPVYKYI